MADLDTLTRALKRAHSAGDVAAARRFAAEIKQIRSAPENYTGQKHPEFDPANVPSGVKGYNRETGMVEPQMSGTQSFMHGAADTASFGFADEIGALAGSLVSGDPYDVVLAEIRRRQESAKEQNPKSHLAGMIGGGIAQGIAAGPATLTARAGTGLGARVAAGMGDGAIMGGAYGVGSGEGGEDRIRQGVTDALIGTAGGAIFPVAAKGVTAGAKALKNMVAGQQAARTAGTKPSVVRMLSETMDADGTLGPRGIQNMDRAGADAMLADAGPNARSILDHTIQRGGPGAIVARDRIDERVARGGQAIMQALDDTLGAPQGVTAARSSIRNSTASARDNAYKAAYSQPIDYANPRGQQIEDLVKNRVPSSAIQAANNLMRAEGYQSKQILAKVADDGSVTFERLPDVMQLDYITRGLNEVADQADGQGKLGGTTAIGRAYSNLSREIRDNLRNLVPEYANALDTAADPIRRSQAVELGSKLFSPSMTRDKVSEAVKGMSKAEREALAQGLRSRVDDAMAQVARTVQDGDVPAREAIKALRDFSTRANREKLATAIGQDKADKLLKELDRISTSFLLRASVAENSKTYARQAMDKRVGGMTEPGVIQTAAQGEGPGAIKKTIQAFTGQTPERIAGRRDAIYSQMADMLTRPREQTSGLFQGMGDLKQMELANELLANRLATGLRRVQTPFVYPTTAQIADKRQR